MVAVVQGIVERAGAGKLPFLKTVATAKHYFDYDLVATPPFPLRFN